MAPLACAGTMRPMKSLRLAGLVGGLSRGWLLELKFNGHAPSIEAQRRSNCAICAAPSFRPVAVDRVRVVLLALLNERSMRRLVGAAGSLLEVSIQRLTRHFKLRSVLDDAAVVRNDEGPPHDEMVLSCRTVQTASRCSQ